MDSIDGEGALRALAETYRAVTAVIRDLPEESFGAPTRCAGWAVREVLFHLLLDPQRALVAFATPTGDRATTDLVEYWRPYRPGREGAERHAEYVRRCAAAYSNPSVLAGQWEETSEAALRSASAVVAGAWARSHRLARAARGRGREEAAPPPPRVRTQGLVIAVPDFLATLVVEAALHHLDLTVNLDAAPAVPAAALRIVRTTLDGLLGTALPPEWDDRTCALAGTGRQELSGAERAQLGPLQERFPLLA